MNFTDAQIIGFIEKDELKGYELLYKQYFTILVKEAFAVLKQKDEAEDEVQQLFLSICQKQSISRKIDNLGGYLVQAIRNRAYNTLKKRNLHFSEEAASELPNHTHNVIQQLTAIEIRTNIEEKLSLLPPKCRQVFEWRFFQGLSHKEIAERGNISLNTVDNHLAKATKTLRNNLQGHFKEIFTASMFWIFYQ